MEIHPALKQDWLRFERKITTSGVPTLVSGLESFKKYASLLYHWSGKINLISPGDRSQLATKHLASSLALLPLVKMVPHKTVLDFGSGAGLPGIPLKIALGESEVILVESRRRRAHFLREVIRHLALEKVEVVNARLEDWPGTGESQVEVVVSRAVKQPDEVWSSINPYLTRYGALIISLAQKQESNELILLERVAHSLERVTTTGMILG